MIIIFNRKTYSLDLALNYTAAYGVPFHAANATNDDLDLDMLDYYYSSRYQHLALMWAMHDLFLNPIHNSFDDWPLVVDDGLMRDT